MKLPYCLPDQGHCVWPSSTWPWRQGQSLVPPVRDNTAHTVALSTTASPSKGPPPGTVAAHTDLSTNNTIIIFNGKKKHAILISQTLAPSEWHCETFQWNIKFHIVFTICMIRSSHLHIFALITKVLNLVLEADNVAWIIYELVDYMMNIAKSVTSYLQCFSGWESLWHTICLLHSV